MVDDETSIIARLFAQEVPEIAAGTIEIKAIARKPGYRSKVALESHDPQVDCIAGCVGVRGARIKKIVDALGGERVDLFPWHESPEKLIRNALQPAAIDKVVLDPERHQAVVIVKAEQAPLVRGHHGENQELASQLCGWEIELEVEEP
jgi:N utilization substance protein A